jgi:xanthine/uracil/vitamin C permease (AzgA family)
MMPLLLSLVMVDFFDTLGTASAVAEEAGVQDERGNIPRLRRILGVDAVSASIGGLFGVSSVTSCALPAFALLAAIPFTYSISHGIGYGFVTFVATKLFSGRPREVHPLMYATAAAFLGYLVFE